MRITFYLVLGMLAPAWYQAMSRYRVGAIMVYNFIRMLLCLYVLDYVRIIYMKDIKKDRLLRADV